MKNENLKCETSFIFIFYFLFFLIFVEENPTIIGGDLITITDILLKTDSDYIRMLVIWLLAHLVVNGKRERENKKRKLKETEIEI